MKIPFGFAGGLHDRDTGLVLFGFRDYDPDVGRWTAKDPVGLTPISIDLYGYCLNDPINWIDPLGLPFLVGGGSVVALGGLEASGGVVIDPGSEGRKVDLYGSAGTGVGLNVSADVFAGWIKGDVTGITENINLVLGPVSLTAFIDPMSSSKGTTRRICYGLC